MKYLSLLLLFGFFLNSVLFSQENKLEISGNGSVAGTLKVGTILTNNAIDSVVVFLPDGTLAIRDVTTLIQNQILSISSDTIFLTNGSFVKLPPDQINDADADSTNELQLLSISNDTIFLTDGALVKLPPDQVKDADADSTNELQSLVLVGDSLALSYSTTRLDVGKLIITYFKRLPNGLSTLIQAGETPENLIATGVTVQELLNSGLTIQEIIIGNVNPLLVMSELSLSVDSLLALDYGGRTSPLQLAISGLSLDSLYGKGFQEGILFYIDTANLISGVDALVAATSNQASPLYWGCLNHSVAGAVGTALGTGFSNTANIVAAGCAASGGAAELCAAYDSGVYDDWFLPSKDELNLMKQNLHLKGHNNFLVEGGGDYWSSSQVNTDNAWSQTFLALPFDNMSFQNSTGKQVG